MSRQLLLLVCLLASPSVASAQILVTKTVALEPRAVGLAQDGREGPFDGVFERILRPGETDPLDPFLSSQFRLWTELRTFPVDYGNGLIVPPHEYRSILEYDLSPVLRASSITSVTLKTSENGRGGQPKVLFFVAPGDGEVSVEDASAGTLTAQVQLTNDSNANFAKLQSVNLTGFFSSLGAGALPTYLTVIHRVDPASCCTSGLGARTLSIVAEFIDSPPSADAGVDQAVTYGQTVSMTGSGSSDDNTSTGSLQYQWSFTSKPAGSLAALSSSTVQSPSFTVDVPGDYELSLTVQDSLGQVSVADTVRVSSLNLPPTARAGADLAGIVGGLLTFDGSSSSDPEDGGLRGAWVLTARPAGSSATLVSSAGLSAHLVPDLAGEYRVSLIVTDPFDLSSMPDEATAQVITPQDHAANETATAQNQIGALPLGSTTINEGNRTALQHFLNASLRSITTNDPQRSQQDLLRAIIRVDGCALRGTPDGNGPDRDWVLNCSDQLPIYISLRSALDALQR